MCVASTRHQTSRLRESRVRGGAASWASLAAVAVCGGAQGCNSAERAGCEAWADSPAIATGPEKKEFFASTWLVWLLRVPPSSESSLPMRFCSAVSGDAQIDVVIGHRLTSHRSEIVVA